MTAPNIPHGLRILLVEDEAVIALTAEDMIDELGGIVSAHATSLPEALDRVEASEFDLALLDINLNGVMSLPVAEALRARGKPFIFTTGYGSAGAHTSFTGAPVVAKPYTLAALASAIAETAEAAGLVAP